MSRRRLESVVLPPLEPWRFVRDRALEMIKSDRTAFIEAVHLTRYGFRLFRTYGVRQCDEGWTCSCNPRGDCLKGSPGKHPRKFGWQEEATSNPLMLAEWSRSARALNVGIATGAPSGMAILDLDGTQALESLARLEDELGPLPQTVESRSGREGVGVHKWFCLAQGESIPPNSASTLAPKIDIRGQGGFAIIPGSTHISGRKYAWERPPGEAEFAFLPEPWLRKLTTPQEPIPRVGGAGVSGRPPRASTGLPGGSTGRIGRDGPPVMGDGPGGEGFNGPIYSWLCRFFRADPDGDPTAFFDLLRDRIDAAPREETAARAASIKRYKSQHYLEGQAKRAQAFIHSQN